MTFMRTGSFLRRGGPALALVFLPTWLFAQSGLTLDEAVAMARRNNGTVQAAYFEYEAARSRVRESFASFLPTITAAYGYERSRTSQILSGSRTVSRANEGFPSVVASWQLLDSGQRSLSHRATIRIADQTGANALQTLRNTLFDVHEQFLNALRAQELLRVADASVERAEEILKATEAQIEAKVAAPKDRLQAEADRLNARVDLLGARNQLSNAEALLKATIGWEIGRALPRLTAPAPPTELAPLPDLADVIREGLARREDLRARRFAIEAQKYGVERARRDAGVSLSLDADYSRNWSDFETDSRSLTLSASYPVFDGSRRREAVRQEQLALSSLLSGYLQSERFAASEIESAYLVLRQNRERWAAAEAALRAARENYAAASEAQRLGAEGTNVITVLTAKISLVTAESNFVDALYDVLISEVRLRLATGQAIPGETT